MQHQNYSNRFGGLQLRLTSQLVSTRLKFIRSDAYSLERTEIEALNREGNQCDDDKVSVNLEKCYMAYTQRQVVHQCKNNFLSRQSNLFLCSFSAHFRGGRDNRNTRYANHLRTTKSTAAYNTLSTF